MSAEATNTAYLIVVAGGQRCALPLSSVVETMRPLPVRPLAEAPPFVAGVSIIRGQPVPVASLATLLGSEADDARRFIVVRAAAGSVAMAVADVVGVRQLAGDALAAVPPLLAKANAEAVAALASLDRDLLIVLKTAHIVDDEVWAMLDEVAPR